MAGGHGIGVSAGVVWRGWNRETARQGGFADLKSEFWKSLVPHARFGDECEFWERKCCGFGDMGVNAACHWRAGGWAV